MTAQLGVMQGRLSPPEGGRIQSFPERTWKDEFAKAKACGLDRIEWIIDEPRWEQNPLMTEAGRTEIARLEKESGVKVRSACADVFMVHPLHSVEFKEQARRERMLGQIIGAAGQAKLEHVDIPFVDASAIATNEAFETVARVFREAAAPAWELGLTLCLETSLEPERFSALLDKIGSPNMKANYDIGNSASLGYAPGVELPLLAPHLACVHIKDRKRGGATVPLGTGDADFDGVVAELRRARYAGHFVLQAARGPEELEWTKGNVAFARRFIERVEAHGLKA